MTTFSIDGRQYRAREFEADVKLSLTLLLGPLFSAMVKAAPDVLAARQRHSEPDQAPDAVAMLAEMAGAVGPVADRLAALERQGDAKGIITACLQFCDQIVDGKPYPVMTKAGIVSNRDNNTFATKTGVAINMVRINFGPTLAGMGLDLDLLMGVSPDADV